MGLQASLMPRVPMKGEKGLNNEHYTAVAVTDTHRRNVDCRSVLLTNNCFKLPDH